MSNVDKLINNLKIDQGFLSNVTRWETIEPKEGVYADFPSSLDGRIVEKLKERGIGRLYSHQGQAVEAVLDGKSTVVVTPTASGKTLCYNLPVIDMILKNPQSRALYLFPTKALSQDQVSELHEIITSLGEDIKTFTYDGDTSPAARQAIRNVGHIVVTNPDMLHKGILPHHTKWVKLFQNLKYVVIDEVHHYRGVFGSHLANVIRRLDRICRFYGSEPIFICSSATIKNPGELAERLTGKKITVIDKNGAPSGEKHFIIYNPPVVNKELGIRKSSILEAKRLGQRLIGSGIQTIVFAKSRVGVEVLLTYLKEGIKDILGRSDSIRGYRGGYLPKERREIERGLREGKIKGIVGTNALELGIDIGQLEACIMVGYPGSISSTWQQSGRAGRRHGKALAIMIANSSPLDQYIAANPMYFFEVSPESGFINPDNLVILISHLKCAAFELPFKEGETFGSVEVVEILDFLAHEGVLVKGGSKYHWMADSFPAEEVSLRSASTENVVIIDITEEPKVIGEVDKFSAPMLIHEDAIYIHQGQQYQVEKYDYDNNKAYIREVNVDFFTDANLAVELKVLDVEGETGNKVVINHGEVMVRANVTMFKKIKMNTHENIGWGPLKFPEMEFHTTAYWISFSPEATHNITASQIESGLVGLGNVLTNIASLHLMCDVKDIKSVSQLKSPFNNMSTIYVYDNYPGGIGFSGELYKINRQLFKSAKDLIISCPCSSGCPSCVGPINEVGLEGKESTLKLIEVVLYEKHAG